jgi:hypothetical protein
VEFRKASSTLVGRWQKERTGVMLAVDAAANRAFVLQDSAEYLKDPDPTDKGEASMWFIADDPNVRNNRRGTIWHDGGDFHMEAGPLTGAGTDTTTESRNAIIFSPQNTQQVMLTPEGGIAKLFTNKTGAASVKGKLVEASSAQDDAVALTGINDVDCIGVFYEDGVADGSEAWIVYAGVADVALDDNTAGTAGNWVGASEAGYADATQASPPAAPAHFQEIGHCLQTVSATGAGTHVTARCMLHFL